MRISAAFAFRVFPEQSPQLVLDDSFRWGCSWFDRALCGQPTVARWDNQSRSHQASASLDDFSSLGNCRPAGSIAAPEFLRRNLPRLGQSIDVPAVTASVAEEEVGPI